jgi:ATP-dependent exoDNAse (exonuclease V) beta subunit
MNNLPQDQAARERFTNEWGVNLAVVANAGSGKTTAISERLAAIALSEGGAEILKATTVVTYTKKAAAQIGQKARSVLLRRMADAGRSDVDALARLDRVFFGTIHSFCLLLARRHGSTLGVHLNPTLVEAGEDGPWNEFLEQDPMEFESLSGAQVATFLRHAPLDEMFELARDLNLATARRLLGALPAPQPPPPSRAVLEEILAAAPKRKGAGADALARNKERASRWLRSYEEGSERLPVADAEGTAGGIRELYRRFFAPLKGWMAEAGGVLAAELSLRYRSWRAERGIQTYADQIETALGVLDDHVLLERIRAEGWRVILDEAQDTDREQFAVLVEIARPPGATRGTWPDSGGEPPRPGHFCMVGDAQQAIYSERAEILNFRRHIEAFASGNGGEQLMFDVTFRTPRRVVRLLNNSLPAAFGRERPFNFGVPPVDGAQPPFLQAGYEPLVAGPGNPEGGAWRLPLAPAGVTGKRAVDDRRLEDEARQVAQFLRAGGPAAVGASAWGDVCILAPRTAWLRIVRSELERAGLKTALQMRRNRNGDNPVYAWLCGLLAVVCDPENTFEWVGVLREVFAVSDALIAGAVVNRGPIRWDEPGDYPGPISAALGAMRPLIERADAPGDSLLSFAAELAGRCALAEKARLLDPEGGLGDELARLLARAAELGKSGSGPRAWLRELLGAIDEPRSAGRPASDAVNLITSHSAKGLEWPVVIPVGLWRSIKFRGPTGLRLVQEKPSRVVFDNDGVGQDTRESIERARLRDLVRLLYVTLTRARTALVIPWSGSPPDGNSFAELWGLDPSTLDLMPPAERIPAVPGPASNGPMEEVAADRAEPGTPAAPFPKRVLPHELALAPDMARAALHESSFDSPFPVNDAADPLEYGVWWHKTLEFVPWTGDPASIAAHGRASLAQAEKLGFGSRAAEEWGRLLASESWDILRNPRWSRLAEAGIFAPLPPDQWIDGVIDLILHDSRAREVWIVDWKTNRRRPGEEDPALLGRLSTEYGRQLSAYGVCASAFFAGCRTRLWVYSTVAGLLTGISGPV